MVTCELSVKRMTVRADGKGSLRTENRSRWIDLEPVTIAGLILRASWSLPRCQYSGDASGSGAGVCVK